MTTNNQEKICFRYDGSPEAEQALKWVNETFDTDWDFTDGDHFTNEGRHIWKAHDINFTYQLVPPAEFLRLVKGETEWAPKYGEEVGIESCLSTQPQTGILKTSFKRDNGDTMYVVQVSEVSWRITPTIRPVRKSLREELSKLIPLINADDIINLFKQHKDEL